MDTCLAILITIPSKTIKKSQKKLKLFFFTNFQDPPDLFSDDGTLTPDALKDGEEGTDESPLHLGNAKKYGQTGIPTDRLKKIRINRKDLKKGGDGLRGKNVMDQYRVKDKDMKRTMK